MPRKWTKSHMPWWVVGLLAGAALPFMLSPIMALAWPIVAKVCLSLLAVGAAILVSLTLGVIAHSGANHRWRRVRRPLRALWLPECRRWKILLLVILFGSFVAVDALSLFEAHVSTAAGQQGQDQRQGYFNSLPSVESFYREPGNGWVHVLFWVPHALAFIGLALTVTRRGHLVAKGVAVVILGVSSCLASQFLFIGLGVISTSFGFLLSLIAGILLATERFAVITQGVGRTQLAAGDPASIEAFRFRWESLRFFTSAALKGLIGLAAVLATGFTILWGLGWGIVETKWLAVRIFTGIAGLLTLVGWGIGLPFWRAFLTLSERADPT